MKIYNEQSKKLEEFKTLKPHEVKMYVCGPTLYGDIHIGNARPIIFFDFVRNVLIANDYQVYYVSNITDVDDKIIKKAQDSNLSEQEVVNTNLEAFNNILQILNIKYYKQPKVMENIDDIINFIKNLVDQQYAYVVDGDVYFDISKINNYGSLSNLKLDNNKEASRIDKNLKKHNSNDFTLWKETNEGIKWQSPWSLGRPGWHTECVVMINNILGDKIDIHGGGIDLQFPHHENELAQSRANHHELATYWMHNGFININNDKMSKSLGNTFLVKDFLTQFHPNVLKLIMYQTNYRQPINITNEFIENTKTINNKLFQYYQTITTSEINYQLGDILKIVNNDFDSANLLTYLLQIIKKNNQENQIIFNSIIKLLNLEYKPVSIPQNIINLAAQREEYKQAKNYQQADLIREQINNQGYIIKDLNKGYQCVKMNQ